MKCSQCFGNGYMCPHCHGTGEEPAISHQSLKGRDSKLSWLNQYGNLNGSIHIAKPIIDYERSGKIVTKKIRTNKRIHVTKYILRCGSCGHKKYLTEEYFNILNKKYAINCSIENIEPLIRNLKQDRGGAS